MTTARTTWELTGLHGVPFERTLTVTVDTDDLLIVAAIERAAEDYGLTLELLRIEREVDE